MDNWDITLLVIAGYFAVMGLMRLMARRRDQVLGRLQRQVEDEQNNPDRFEHAPRDTKAA
ncbi:MAG: hypothetical protein JXB10_16235 [Pirellulales bacterium]|nr:hypothetical protein [Pirellulales bacterium]